MRSDIAKRLLNEMESDPWHIKFKRWLKLKRWNEEHKFLILTKKRGLLKYLTTMNETEIKNAVIESVTIDMGDRGLLTAWLQLNYGGSGQGFGGFSLYLPKSYTHFTEKGDFAGHFLFRCMEIAGVESWEKMKGKTVRVKSSHSKVEAIGHIVKDDWFNPSEDFKRMMADNLKPKKKM